MKRKVFFIAYCIWCVGIAIYSGYWCYKCAAANEVAYAVINGVCSALDLACMALVMYAEKKLGK